MKRNPQVLLKANGPLTKPAKVCDHLSAASLKAFDLQKKPSTKAEASADAALLLLSQCFGSFIVYC